MATELCDAGANFKLKTDEICGSLGRMHLKLSLSLEAFLHLYKLHNIKQGNLTPRRRMELGRIKERQVRC